MTRTKNAPKRAIGKAKKAAKPAATPAPATGAAVPAAPFAIHVASPDDRSEAGKALRGKIARLSHGAWKRHEGRRDPIELLRESDKDRMPELVPIKYGRMLQSPFTFYRGAAGVMAADLAHAPTTGFRVQACGDCHLMNFGGFATPERKIVFDINDFDETLPAPWEWDVKRLVASFVLAARSNGLSDAKARDAAMACARSYRKRLREFADLNPLQLWYARFTAKDMIELVPAAHQDFVRERVEKASARAGSDMDFPTLAETVGGRIRINDAPPLIFHPEQSHAPDFIARLEKVFAAYRDSLPEDRRLLLDRYKIIDAAIKVVGIGSVGRRCWIVLLMSEGNHPLFLQVKEAVESVLEPYAGKSAYGHHGERVVMGQRLTQPASDLFLGWCTSPETGVNFYVRQLRDAKIKPLVDTFDSELLEIYAKACGWVLARAHAKTSDVAAIRGYLGASDEFDEAMGKFALAYADQAERDHAALKAAVRKGTVKAFQEND
jgi:uncharacterized protein (DUF2252 family)